MASSSSIIGSSIRRRRRFYDGVWSIIPGGPGAGPASSNFDIAPIATPRRPSASSQLSANIEIRGYMPDHLNFVAYFMRHTAQARGLPTSPEVIHMPTIVKRWHVTRGPFVHDKSKELFEQKTHRRLLQIFDTRAKDVSDLVAYINANLPSGVDMVVQRFDPEDVNGLRKRLESVVAEEEAAAQRAFEVTKGPAAATAEAGAAEDSKSADGDQKKPSTRSARRLSYAEDVRERVQEFIKNNS